MDAIPGKFNKSSTNLKQKWLLWKGLPQIAKITAANIKVVTKTTKNVTLNVTLVGIMRISNSVYLKSTPSTLWKLLFL